MISSLCQQIRARLMYIVTTITFTDLSSENWAWKTWNRFIRSVQESHKQVKYFSTIYSSSTNQKSIWSSPWCMCSVTSSFYSLYLILLFSSGTHFEIVLEYNFASYNWLSKFSSSFFISLVISTQNKGYFFYQERCKY